MSFRFVRNLSLAIMLAIILSISLVSFVGLQRIIANLSILIEYERPRLSLIQQVEREFFDARDSFFDFYMGKNNEIGDIITAIDNVINDSERLRGLVSDNYKDDISRLIISARRFKTTVVVYADERKYDPTGSASIAMEQQSYIIFNEFRETLKKIIKEVQDKIAAAEKEMLIVAGKYQEMVFFGIALGVIAALLTAYFMGRALSGPIDQLIAGIKRIGKGDLGVTINVESDDELGGLIASFNIMSRKLAASQQQLKASEQQLRASNQQLRANEEMLRVSGDHLREKVQELEKFRKMVVGRELKMVALKEEVDGLLKKLGKEPKYGS